jgi:flagellar biosynthesis protein FlhG
LIEHPEARISKCIEKVARRMLGRDEPPLEPAPGDSHYELLEVDPSATEEEIRRANRRIRQIYSRDSVVVAGLYSRTRLEHLHRRLDDAYDVLMDPRRRKEYDLER